MVATLDYRLKDAPAEFWTRWPVLTIFILHANVRNRCWPSMRRLSKRVGKSLPWTTAAKQWLIDHGAITLVPYEQRIDDEKKAPPRQHIYQLTGVIKFGETEYPYLYVPSENGDPDDQPSGSSKRSKKPVNDQPDGSSMINPVNDQPHAAVTISSIDSSISNASNPNGLEGADAPGRTAPLSNEQRSTLKAKAEQAKSIAFTDPSKRESETPIPSSAAPLSPPLGKTIAYDETSGKAHVFQTSTKHPTTCVRCHIRFGTWGEVPGNKTWERCCNWDLVESTWTPEVQNRLAAICKKDPLIPAHKKAIGGCLASISKREPVTIEKLDRFERNWYRCKFKGQKGEIPAPYEVTNLWVELTESDECKDTGNNPGGVKGQSNGKQLLGSGDRSKLTREDYGF